MNTDRRERLEARRAESIRRVLQEEWMEFADEASLDPEWLAQLETELIAEQGRDHPWKEGEGKGREEGEEARLSILFY